jgi:antitoxin component YwqK of YwqJK toxin-antitoxin module
MELQIAHHVVKLYYPNGRLKEQIDYDATGQKHGSHLQYTEDGQLDIVHFYECGQLICAL